MISSYDIENKKFDKSWKGYDVDQVDEFLDDIVATIENLIRLNGDQDEELKKLKTENEELIAEREKYRQKENQIQNAIISSQEKGDDILSKAKLEASEIVSKANQTSKITLDNLAVEKNRIETEIERNVKEYNQMKDKMELFLESELENLKTNIVEFKKKDSTFETTKTEEKKKEVEPSKEPLLKKVTEVEETLDTNTKEKTKVEEKSLFEELQEKNTKRIFS